MEQELEHENFGLLHDSAIFTQTVTAVKVTLLSNHPTLHFTCAPSILAARNFYAYGVAIVHFIIFSIKVFTIFKWVHSYILIKNLSTRPIKSV